MEGFLCKRLHLKVFILASFGSQKRNKGIKRNGEECRSKKRIEEEWIEMQKSKVNYSFFSTGHLSVPDFLNEKRSIGIR